MWRRDHQRETRADGDAAVRKLAREVSSLQAGLLADLHREIGREEGDAFALAAQELAEAFGSVAATAVGAVAERSSVVREDAPGLLRAGADAAPAGAAGRDPQALRPPVQHSRSSTSRAPAPAMAIPAAGGETALAVVDAALRDSVRLVDESLPPAGATRICVLAPDQDAVGGVQMAERLLRHARRARGAPGACGSAITAGVVACPEHGADAETLLREADEAMWRARAVGQPVGLGTLRPRPVQDR